MVSSRGAPAGYCDGPKGQGLKWRHRALRSQQGVRRHCGGSHPSGTRTRRPRGCLRPQLWRDLHTRRSRSTGTVPSYCALRTARTSDSPKRMGRASHCLGVRRQDRSRDVQPSPRSSVSLQSSSRSTGRSLGRKMSSRLSRQRFRERRRRSRASTSLVSRRASACRCCYCSVRRALLGPTTSLGSSQLR
jgi:hypothetical protein